MEDKKRRVVIVGGGLTGLSAAFYIRKHYRAAGVEPAITLLEKSSSMGGIIETLHRDGFVIEKGPDSFLARKTAMIDLAKELEMDHELVSQNPESKKTYIMQRGKLHPMPAGLVLGIPTELRPFLRSGLVSPAGKLRALMDFIIPPKRTTEDESLGYMIERRLGAEVLENLTEPLLAGIYAGDMRKLSLQATFPQFGEVERDYGSLIRGMMTGRKPTETHTGTKRSAFLNFRQGLQSLVHALVHELDDVDQRLNTAAISLQRSEQQDARYRVELHNGEWLDADDVVITVPTYVASSLLKPHVDTSALDAINYVSVANVVLAFEKKEIQHVFDGSGFLVPRKEGRNITACTWTSTKWLHTSPEDKVLLRCYVGRSGDEQNVELSDEALTELVMKDLRETMGIDASPIFSEITRMRRAMPQYPVGHLQHLADLRKELGTKVPGVYIAGAGYEGVGLPDCVRQAKEMSMQAVTQLAAN